MNLDAVVSRFKSQRRDEGRSALACWRRRNYPFKHPPPLADSETSGLQVILMVPGVLRTLNRYETEKKTTRIQLEGNPIFQSSCNIEAMCNSKTVWQQSLSTSGTTSNPNIFEILGTWSRCATNKSDCPYSLQGHS